MRLQNCDQSPPVEGTYFTYLEYLKCYAIFLVVALHVSAAGSYQWTNPAAASWWISTAFGAFTRSCVPLFLMASGATLLDTLKVTPISRFLMRRAGRVIVPLAAWSLIYLIYRAWWLREAMTGRAIIGYLLTGTTFYHLPFFYYLIGLYLSAPVLVRFAERTTRKEQLYLFVLFGMVISMQLASMLSGIPFWLTVPALAGYSGYFMLGRILRDTAIGPRAVKACLLVVGVGWLPTLLGTYWLTRRAGHLDQLVFDYNSPNVVAMTIASFLIVGSKPVRVFAARQPRISALAQLGASLSFGIYLVHPLLLQVLIPKLHLAWNTGGALVGVLLTTLATLTLSGLLVLLARRVPFVRRTVG